MVFDETRDMRDSLKRLGKFFAHESCGKCYPCQMGTQRQMEILERVANKTVLPGDFVRLEDVGWTMTDASLCGLGQTAASAVLSAMKLWPELFIEESKVEGQVVSQFSKVSKVSKVSKGKPKTVKKPVVKKTATKKVAKVSKVSKAKPKAVKKVVKATAKKSKKTTTKKK